MTQLAPEIDARFRDLALELGAVAARVGELTDVISGESLAIPRRLTFDATNTIREFSVDRGGREFHSLKVDNPTNYPLYISFASNRGGNASDYDEIVEPGTGGIFTRPYEIVSIGFDPAARPAGAVAIPAVFYARPLPPTRWDLDFAGDQAVGQYLATAPTLADQTLSPLLLDARGNLRVVVDTAVGTMNVPGNVTDGNVMNDRGLPAAGYIFNGVNWDRARTPNVFKEINGFALAANGTAVLWTPAAGKKFRVMGYYIGISVAALSWRFLDGATPTGIMGVRAGANEPSSNPPMGNGLLSAAANNALSIGNLTSTAAVVYGYVFGTEE